MKAIYQGQEIELDETMEEGKKELDKLTKENSEISKIDLEDTQEITEEMLEKIINTGEEDV